MTAPPLATEVCHIAQNLARNCGYAVFPCISAPGDKERDKKPATPHGFKDASKDPDAVAKLWRRYPGPLIGVACGDYSGISVLDVDQKHDAARAWWRQNCHRLPATTTYRTRSGGMHLYYQHVPDVRNVEGKPVPGSDVRGQGGYAIFWFATGIECLDHTPAAPWPEWLTTFFWPLLPPPKPKPTRKQVDQQDDERWQRIRDRAIEQVRTASKGQGHARLRGAARLLAGYAAAAGWSDADITGWLSGAAGKWSRVSETIAWGIEDGRKQPLSPEARS
jgi:hypothetical protein